MEAGSYYKGNMDVRVHDYCYSILSTTLRNTAKGLEFAVRPLY